MTRNGRVGGLIVIGAALAALVGWGAWPALQAQGGGQDVQRPTFRAGTHFVRVDAYPTKDGQIVRGLSAADFEVLENGRPQAIETFDFLEFASFTPDAERRDPNSVQEGFRLAADPRYRVFVLYFDVYHTPWESSTRLRQPLAEMLERMVGPRDMFGLLTPRQSPAELTLGQRALGIQRQLDTVWDANTAGAEQHGPDEMRLFTCFPTLGDEQREDIIQARRLDKVYTDLEQLVPMLGAIRQERKNIVLLSDHLSGPELDDSLLVRPQPHRPAVGVNRTGRVGIDQPESPAFPDRRWCDETLGRLIQLDNRERRRQIVLAARRQNVAFYVVRPSGLDESFSLMSDAIGPLFELAAETDGIAAAATNDLRAALRQVVDHLSAYYLLGYYTSNTNWNGATRRITVRLRSTGETVRSRREYRAPTETEMAAMREAAAASPGVTDPAVAARQSALGELARLDAPAELFVNAVPTAGGLQVAVELPSRRTSQQSAGGAAVRVEVAGAGNEMPVVATARIDPGSRGALVRVADAGEGPWKVTIAAERNGGLLREIVDVSRRDPGGPGRPLLFRATPSPRSPLLPAAELLFRRTERVHLAWPMAEAPEQVDARLLGAAGEPLAVPVAMSQRADGDAVVVMADVLLAPLAAADYIIEVAMTWRGVTRVVHQAIRVVR